MGWRGEKEINAVRVMLAERMVSARCDTKFWK